MTLQETISDFEVQASEAVAMMKALANEKRLIILCKLLEHGEMSVLSLSAEVGLSQSALSQHLARMREENIVGFRRNAQTLYYRVTDPRVLKILNTLKSIYC